jgi:hypothetical protein
MPWIPLRWIFRSRYAALLWAGGICMTAYNYAGPGVASVDAANSADSNAAQLSALIAEDS